jgi:hypothetical protein
LLTEGGEKVEYRFMGSLCGYLCEECREPLSGVKVRLYRAARQITERAAADPKDTFELVSADGIKGKAGSLIAETVTDDKGNFTFDLGPKQKYDGEAFEIDVYCETVPGHKATGKAPEPVQFSITTLQPQWRQSGDRLVAAWQYCVPSRFWCHIRSRFGAWTICGMVKVCKTKSALGGVRVFALDRDWLQDDPLGSAVTDGSGHFRIDYTAAAFQKTIFPSINIELFGGPDIYFRIETLGGTVLLAEPASRGRDADRSNRGPCFCVELCVPEGPSQNPTILSAFTNLGGYDFTNGQVDIAGTGLTNDNRAFFSNVRLNGVLAQTLNNQPLEYMFEVKDITGGGAYTQVAMGQISPVQIGKHEVYAPAFVGDPNPVKTKPYVVNGTPGPSVLVPSVTADGWIQVPQENNVFNASGAFAANGNMIGLITTSLNAWPAVDLTGLSGGVALSAGQLATDRIYGIRMWVREAGNPGSAVIAGECARAAIDNRLYNNENHHPYWAGGVVNGELGVHLLEIQELKVAPCSELSGSLTVTFTAGHPNLGAVSITMTGPGGPYAFSLPAAVAGQQFGTATPNGWTMGSLGPCAYIVTLSVQILLTTGDGVPNNLVDQIAFCKM